MILNNFFKKYQTELCIFLITIVFITFYNVLEYGQLYAESTDGNLYISISKNFLSSFHFIQTSRPHEINMVVPPGLPFIITLLHLIGNTTSFVVFFQYLLFAFANILFYKSSYNFFKSKFVGILCVIVYCLSDAILISAASPRYILTETYTQFIFISILYIMSLTKYDFETKTKLLMPILLIGSLIRTVLFSLLVFDIIIYIVLLLKHKHSFKYLFNFGLITILILGLNVIINYKETGEFILLQNYGGTPLYQANNPNTSTVTYDSSKIKSFSDEYFFEVYNNSKLSTSEKSNLLSAKAKQYIKNNFSQFIKNTLIKFKNLFIVPYKLDFYIWFLGTFILYFITKRKELLFLFATNIIIMILTSIGLNIYRYSIFMTIYYTFIKLGIIYSLFNILIQKYKPNIILKGKEN